MKAYKLTDPDGLTFGGTQWGEGITHHTNGEGTLCGPGWLHFYNHPVLAVLLDFIHVGFGPYALLWEAEAEGRFLGDNGLKFGCTKLTTLRQIPKPKVSPEKCAEFAIRCAVSVHKDVAWRRRATKWLDRIDKSAHYPAAEIDAARYADAAARYAACAARYAAVTADISNQEMDFITILHECGLTT